MNTVVAVALLIGLALMLVGERYRHHKQVETRRRYVDIAAKCAAAAGFVLHRYSDGFRGDGVHPSYTYTHPLHPGLALFIEGHGWRIRESLSGLRMLPEPQFKERRGHQFSATDFNEVVEEYRAIVEWRRQAVGWGCLADLTHSHEV